MSHVLKIKPTQAEPLSRQKIGPGRAARMPTPVWNCRYFIQSSQNLKAIVYKVWKVLASRYQYFYWGFGAYYHNFCDSQNRSKKNADVLARSSPLILRFGLTFTCNNFCKNEFKLWLEFFKRFSMWISSGKVQYFNLILKIGAEEKVL